MWPHSGKGTYSACFQGQALASTLWKFLTRQPKHRIMVVQKFRFFELNKMLSNTVLKSSQPYTAADSSDRVKHQSLPMIYTAPYIMVLMRASTLRSPFEGLGPEFSTFLGQCPKKSLIQAPTLQMAWVMYLSASKPLCIGPYKSVVHR